jgi:hypothetical protein
MRKDGGGEKKKLMWERLIPPTKFGNSQAAGPTQALLVII